MKRYKRIKGWFVIGEHLGSPIYMKSGMTSRNYVWRKGQFHTLEQIAKQKD